MKPLHCVKWSTYIQEGVVLPHAWWEDTIYLDHKHVHCSCTRATNDGYSTDARLRFSAAAASMRHAAMPREGVETTGIRHALVHPILRWTYCLSIYRSWRLSAYHALIPLVQRLQIQNCAHWNRLLFFVGIDGVAMAVARPRRRAHAFDGDHFVLVAWRSVQVVWPESTLIARFRCTFDTVYSGLVRRQLCSIYTHAEQSTVYTSRLCRPDQSIYQI